MVYDAHTHEMGGVQMHRKSLITVGLISALALFASACTIPAPAERTWKVRPVSIKVIDQEDYDPGDEPYVIQLAFRSKLGVPNSSSAFVVSQCRTPGAMPATNVGTPGTEVPIPAGSADVVFPKAQNLDVGDVLLGTAPLEIFGTLTFAMERDGLFAGSCAVTDMLQNVLTGTVADALDLLIANSATPPTQEDLINLIVSHLGDFLSAVPGLIAAVLEGLGNPDDILGVAAQIHLPTAGAFTDLLRFGLALAGLDNGVIESEDLPSALQVRVGSLTPSSASFTFSGPGYSHVLKTEITA